jgi:hypothetical protein
LFQFEVIYDPRLRTLGDQLIQELEPEVDVVSFLLRDRWQQMAAETGSVKSGRYRDSIEVRLRNWLEGENNERHWAIYPDVNYDVNIEAYLRPKPGFRSKDGRRQPAGLAVESAEPDITKMLGDATERAVGWLK